MRQPTGPGSEHHTLTVAVRSDVGLVRDNNEDASGLHWLDDGSLLVMVCDGMGGHEAGEVASHLAVQVLQETIARNTFRDPRERLHGALLAANEAIVAEGKQPGRRGMGTTAILGLIHGNEAHVGLVGDSRLYHIRSGHVLWRTRDHTRVQMLIDRGFLTPVEARTHADAGMLTRALGHRKMANGQPLQPEVLAEPLRIQPGDCLVLCSDGLHDLVEDAELGELVSGRTADHAADRLVTVALERGGHDNVTVAVVIHGATAAPFDPSATFSDAEEQEETYDLGNGAVELGLVPRNPVEPTDPPAPDPGLHPAVFAFVGAGVLAAIALVLLALAAFA